MLLNRRTEAQYWLHKYIGSTIKFIDNKNIICSVKLLEQSESQYNNKLNEFVNSSLSSNYAMKLNDFGSKYSSFAQAAKVTKDSRNMNKKANNIKQNEK